MLFDCRFKVLKVSRFSKLPCFRLSPNRFPERSSERRAFIVGHTSIVGISSSQFSEKSKLPREIGNWKIFVNRLFLTDRLLQVNATFYSTLWSSSFLDSSSVFQRVLFIYLFIKSPITCSLAIWLNCHERYRSTDCNSCPTPTASAEDRTWTVLSSPGNCTIDLRNED